MPLLTHSNERREEGGETVSIDGFLRLSARPLPEPFQKVPFTAMGVATKQISLQT